MKFSPRLFLLSCRRLQQMSHDFFSLCLLLEKDIWGSSLSFTLLTIVISSVISSKTVLSENSTFFFCSYSQAFLSNSFSFSLFPTLFQCVRIFLLILECGNIFFFLIYVSYTLDSTVHMDTLHFMLTHHLFSTEPSIKINVCG